MLDVLREQFILAGRAKGLDERTLDPSASRALAHE